ncbi:MAG: VCBS repeat-containing protein [Actinobacteria bacterium]|nr:VCBS repeat-containing protein [Actinomycetota bacterium]
MLYRKGFILATLPRRGCFWLLSSLLCLLLFFSTLVGATLMPASRSMAAVNDANGDGKSDAITLYNYGGGSTSAWEFQTTTTTANSVGLTFAPSIWWTGASTNVGTTVAGDFNGDGMGDFVSLQNSGGTNSTFLFWRSTGTSYAQPVQSFSSSNWASTMTQLVAGDFDGDGRDELIAFYNYGGTNTGVLFFDTNTDGTFKYPSMVFSSPNWDWSKTTLLALKDGGKSKVVAAYNYGGTTMGLLIFTTNTDGTMNYPQLAFISNFWAWTRTQFLAGDVNVDGKEDVIGFYNYGGTNTGGFVFTSTGTSLNYPTMVFSSSLWDTTRSTFSPGDFNGDGKGDAAIVYDYGNSTTGVWLFMSNGSALTNPVMVYSTPLWNNGAANWIMPY